MKKLLVLVQQACRWPTVEPLLRLGSALLEQSFRWIGSENIIEPILRLGSGSEI
jgi:hypothetical protein